MTSPAWWNLDSYLAEVIAHNLRDYARNSSGYPSGMTSAQWDAKINSIAERLESYQYRLEASPAQETIIVNNTKAAMHELADIFPQLWT